MLIITQLWTCDDKLFHSITRWKPVAFQGVLSNKRMFSVLALTKQFLGSSAQTLLQRKRGLMQQYHLLKQSEWPTDWRKSQSKKTFSSVGGGEAWGLWLNEIGFKHLEKQFLSCFPMKGSGQLCGLQKSSLNHLSSLVRGICCLNKTFIEQTEQQLENVMSKW